MRLNNADMERSVSYADVYEWIRHIEWSGNFKVLCQVALGYDRKTVQVVPKVTVSIHRTNAGENGNAFVAQASATYGRDGQAKTLPAAMLQCLLIIDRDIDLDNLLSAG